MTNLGLRSLRQVYVIPQLGRAAILIALLCGSQVERRLSADDDLPAAKPVPVMQVVPLPDGQASVQRDGMEIARYHFDPRQNRPFLFPLIGPSGRSLTRMGHPRDPNGHSHHNSVWVSHNMVDGVDFWGDRGAGRIVHRRVNAYEDTDGEARIDVHNDWVDGRGRKMLEERRTMRFRPAADAQWWLWLDLELRLPEKATQPVTLDKTPFGLVGVRMAKTIGVHDGGGRIRNSEGGVNEAGVFWKRARWVDYSGPITPQTREGITLMDHPSNPNHPSFFHVRDDGWMGASVTHEAARAITGEAPLKLRYALWVHRGVPDATELNRRFAEFAEVSGVE